MKLTQLLKAWALEHCDINDDASDDEFKSVLSEALVTGSLTAEKYHELSVDPEDEKASEAVDKIGKIESSLEKLTDLLAQQQIQQAAQAKLAESPKPKAEPEVEQPEPKKEESGLRKLITDISDESTAVDPSSNVRVKGAHEAYDATKSTPSYPATQKSGRPHPLAGQPMKNMGRTIELSQLDEAVSGAYAKFMIACDQHKSRRLAIQTMPDHDRELLQYAVENMKWCGAMDGGLTADIVDRKLHPHEQKALIDDGGASGGTEAAPIVFDDQVIQTPLLHGELFPLVNVVPIDRGRRIEGVVLGQVFSSPYTTWGGVDDTPIALFNTASYVSEFNTTIHRWNGAITVGLDFMSDTPIDFNAVITSQIGEQLLEDLDDAIADGNGTTQPEGVIQKSGITDVAFSSTTSLGNYESLRFTVAKAEHRGPVASTAVFCGNETSYQRARAIPVGAADARRLGGMDYASYSWMGIPYKINETLLNTELFYVVLGRYRMYRRRGLTIRTSTEGDTLIRDNSMLIVATARYGGQLERAAAGAITTDAPG
jgi:HK97 family phage major capsid protein